MANGILFVATGNQKFVRQALISRRSIRRFHPDLKIGIYTDLEVGKEWDVVVRAKCRYSSGDGRLFDSKIDGLINTPFDNTLYLDADTFILNDFIEIFDLLERFDLLYCYSHYGNKKNKIFRGLSAEFGKKQKVISKSIPNQFHPLQGGMFLYRISKVLELFQRIKSKYNEKGWWDDQPSILEAVWESDCKIYVLPTSYNFCKIRNWILWRSTSYSDLTPIIWHYTLHKKFISETDMYKIELIINGGNKLRIVFLLLRLKFIKKA